MSRTETDLDGFANLYLDAISYREQLGQANIKLGENELEAVKFMRERLLQYLASKHGVSSETHDIAVDIKARKLVTVERPAPAPQGPEPAATGDNSS